MKYKQLVAVVTPHHRFPLSEDEAMSLRHLRTYLGQYDRYIIGPRKLPADLDDFILRKFSSHWFESANSYNRLLVSKDFYEAFESYHYILIYQLDCLVFSKDLEAWCRKNWDYVGAPWMASYSHEETGSFWKVGNGGLALRHVGNALKVLNSKRLWVSPGVAGMKTRFSEAPAFVVKAVQFLKTRMHAMGYKNRVQYLIEDMASDDSFHEDLFWSLYAKHFLPEFHIPSPEEAVKFSYECAPRHCFKITGGQLPFGCHAWAKYDRSFWEPFLLK